MWVSMCAPGCNLPMRNGETESFFGSVLYGVVFDHIPGKLIENAAFFFVHVGALPINIQQLVSRKLAHALVLGNTNARLGLGALHQMEFERFCCGCAQLSFVQV